MKVLKESIGTVASLLPGEGNRDGGGLSLSRTNQVAASDVTAVAVVRHLNFRRNTRNQGWFSDNCEDKVEWIKVGIFFLL